MQTSAPLVTVIALCYNQSRFIADCFQGILDQTYPNLEVVAIDDCSTDGTPEIVSEWIRSRGLAWKFLQPKVNGGVCRALNHALASSKGPYISMTAADDLWLPDKIRQQVEILNNLPETTGVVYSDAYQMDEAGRALPKMFIEAHRQFDSFPDGDIELALWEGNFIPAMTTLIRRSCYDSVGTYDESLFAEDWDMWLRIARGFRYKFSPHACAKYRIVGTSLVRSKMHHIVDGSCRMCLKHLKERGLPPHIRRAAVSQLARQAINSYKIATPRHRWNLYKALFSEPSVGTLAAFLCASAGIAHPQYERLRQRLRFEKLSAKVAA